MIGRTGVPVKRRVAANRFDNWYGYERGKRVVSFANDPHPDGSGGIRGTAEEKAKAWLVAEAEPGREFMCIGPNCWGRAKTQALAVAICLKNFSKSFGGPWRYMMYDVPAGARLDDMGLNITYDAPVEGAAEIAPSKEVYRMDGKTLPIL